LIPVCICFCHVEPLNRNRKQLCRKCIIYWKKIYVNKADSSVNLDHSWSLHENLTIQTIAYNSNCHSLIFTGNPFLLWISISRNEIPMFVQYEKSVPFISSTTIKFAVNEHYLLLKSVASKTVRINICILEIIKWQ
jgi:hypothetical protein